LSEEVLKPFLPRFERERKVIIESTPHKLILERLGLITEAVI